MEYTILLLDDNKATNFIHEKFILKIAGKAKVISFNMGQDALDYLGDLSNPFPTFLFVDINMPTMDAWEFLDGYNEIYRSEKEMSKVYLLTTAQSPRDQRKMKSYPYIEQMLLKPLMTDTVYSILN